MRQPRDWSLQLCAAACALTLQVPSSVFITELAVRHQSTPVLSRHICFLSPEHTGNNVLLTSLALCLVHDRLQDLGCVQWRTWEGPTSSQTRTHGWGRGCSDSHCTSSLRTNTQNRKARNPVLDLKADFISFALHKSNWARKLSQH